MIFAQYLVLLFMRYTFGYFSQRWLVTLLENISHSANDRQDECQCVCPEPGAFLGRQLPERALKTSISARANRQGGSVVRVPPDP